LFVSQIQTIALVPDFSESLNEFSNCFIVPLLEFGQISNFHLVDAKSDHLMIELAGGDVNYENVSPDRDEENKCILSASMFPASPHWMMNRVMCSIVDVSSCPENLVKSGTLNLGGNGI
jgi:hypothetical protein